MQRLDQSVESEDLHARGRSQPRTLRVDEQPPGKGLQFRYRVEALCIFRAEAGSRLRLDGDEPFAPAQQ